LHAAHTTTAMTPLRRLARHHHHDHDRPHCIHLSLWLRSTIGVIDATLMRVLSVVEVRCNQSLRLVSFTLSFDGAARQGWSLVSPTAIRPTRPFELCNAYTDLVDMPDLRTQRLLLIGADTRSCLRFIVSYLYQRPCVLFGDDSTVECSTADDEYRSSEALARVLAELEARIETYESRALTKYLPAFRLLVRRGTKQQQQQPTSFLLYIIVKPLSASAMVRLIRPHSCGCECARISYAPRHDPAAIRVVVRWHDRTLQRRVVPSFAAFEHSLHATEAARVVRRIAVRRARRVPHAVW